MAYVRNLVLAIFGFSLLALGQMRMIPHVTDPQGSFETRVMLVNAHNDAAGYAFTAYDAGGEPLGTAQGMLAPQHTAFYAIIDLFGTDRVSHFAIGDTTAVTVFVAYQLKVGGSPAQVKETALQARRWQFFPGDGVEVTDGFAVVNMGDADARITLQTVGFSGSDAEPMTLFDALPPMAKGLYVIDNALLNSGTDEAFILTGDQPLALMALRFKNPDNRFFWEVPAEALAIPPQEDPFNPKTLTVLFTSDEHGWLEPTETTGGAAGMMGLWRDREGYTEDGPFLALSGGDMWTGPAISTWTRGAAMVDVMNAMGYSAAALGNHEFDFGLDGLRDRLDESRFPYLAANLRIAESTSYPDFVVPYVIEPVAGIDVGIIGLISTATPEITFESVTGGFDFLEYEAVLNQIVPEMRRNGADLIVLLAHECGFNLETIMPLAAQLGVDLVTGGHCHHVRLEDHEGVPLIEVGAFMERYAKISFSYDSQSRSVEATQAELVENIGGIPDEEVAQIVAYWADQTEAILGEVIGYASETIERRSNEMENMIVDSWLIAFPHADIAMTNYGGIRQSIPQGEITVATIMGVLPFENFIVEMQLTGSQIIDEILCCTPLLGGMTTVDGYALNDGSPLEEDVTYTVLATDFMYEGGSGFLFQDQDPDPYTTGISWRQPLIDWIRSLNTTASNPLNRYLDGTARY